MKIIAYIVARLKEPSTYAGLAALIGLIGLKIAPEQIDALVTVATAIAGALAVFIPDLKNQA